MSKPKQDRKRTQAAAPRRPRVYLQALCVVGAEFFSVSSPAPNPPLRDAHHHHQQVLQGPLTLLATPQLPSGDASVVLLQREGPSFRLGGCGGLLQGARRKCSCSCLALPQELQPLPEQPRGLLQLEGRRPRGLPAQLPPHHVYQRLPKQPHTHTQTHHHSALLTVT